MFKDDYKSMMDDVPVNEALRAELLEKAQKAEESKSNVVKIPFIRRHTRSIASIAACVVIAAAAVGVVPNLMEEETPETTEVYEIPTSTKTPAPIQTDEEYEAALAAEATEEPIEENEELTVETTDEPSAIYTPSAGFAANIGIVQGGMALQTSAPAAGTAADESKTQTSGSSSESAQTASVETAHTHTAVTTEETETASTSAARAAENTDTEAAGISTTALEEEEAAATAVPTPTASNGVLSYSTSSSSAALPSGASSSGAVSSTTSSGSSSSSSSSSGSVSSSSSASSSSSSSSSARSYSRSVIDYDSAAAYVENASHVFIVNGVKVGAYESGGTWKAYYVADNVGYVVTFTGYDSLSDIKEAIKVYI